MKNLTIREAEESDSLNISVLKKQVFISTYALSGINNDFSNHITSEFSIEKIKNSISNKNTIVLLAERKGFLIGIAEVFLKSKHKAIKDSSPELNVLYVFEHSKGIGVGYKLISQVENIVKEMGFLGLWLTVYYKNQNAIKFYERQQYKDVGKEYFEMQGKKYENRILFKQF